MSPDELNALFGGTAALVIGITIVSFCFTGVAIVGSIFLIRRVVGGGNRKLAQTGVAGQGTILSIQQTGVMVNYQPQALLRLKISVPGWEEYEAETKMVIPQVNIPSFQPGATFPVKVDPNNRQKVMLDVYG